LVCEGDGTRRKKDATPTARLKRGDMVSITTRLESARLERERKHT
jgi:hypothetical protein